MMKMNYKNISKAVLISLLALGLVLPVLSLAKNENKGFQGEDAKEGEGNGSQAEAVNNGNDSENKNGNKGEPNLIASQKGNLGEAFCRQIAKTEQIQNRFIENKKNLEEKRKERGEKIILREQERVEKRAENREKWDANRADHFAKLTELAKSDEKKQAVAEFQNAVAEAISAHRTALDQSLASFRDKVDQLIEARESSSIQSINEFENKVQAAIEKAKQGCLEESVDPVALRNTFREEVNAAKSHFNLAKGPVEEIKVQIKDFQDVKKEEMKKASDEFKSKLQEAKDKMLAIFGQASDSSEDTEENSVE